MLVSLNAKWINNIMNELRTHTSATFPNALTTRPEEKSEPHLPLSGACGLRDLPVLFLDEDEDTAV